MEKEPTRGEDSGILPSPGEGQGIPEPNKPSEQLGQQPHGEVEGEAVVFRGEPPSSPVLPDRLCENVKGQLDPLPEEPVDESVGYSIVYRDLPPEWWPNGAEFKKALRDLEIAREITPSPEVDLELYKLFFQTRWDPLTGQPLEPEKTSGPDEGERRG